MFESSLYGTLGDFIEGDPLDSRGRLGFALLELFGLLLFRAVAVEFAGEMGGNGFPLAVRVRRKIDCICGRRQLFQLGDNFFFTRDDDVIRLEIVFDIDAQRALRQILDVPERGLYREALTQIFLDGLRLGRRFDND